LTPAEVLSEAARIGLVLRAEGDRIIVRPARDLPSGLADEIRANRGEVLALLVALPHEEVYGAAPVSSDLRALVCLTCRGTDFWRGRGAVVCRRCHPPAPGAEVLTSSGPGSGERALVKIERDARSGGAV